MMFLFRKYKKLMILLIYVHSFKMTYIKESSNRLCTFLFYRKDQSSNKLLYVGFCRDHGLWLSPESLPWNFKALYYSGRCTVSVFIQGKRNLSIHVWFLLVNQDFVASFVFRPLFVTAEGQACSKCNVASYGCCWLEKRGPFL